jgi:hypothetical protein
LIEQARGSGPGNKEEGIGKREKGIGKREKKEGTASLTFDLIIKE